MTPRKMRAGEDPAGVGPALLYLLVGPLLWAGHLFLSYGLQAVLCALGVTGTARVEPLLIELLVVAFTVGAAVALLYTLWRPRGTARLLGAADLLDGENGTFMVSVMRLLSALSLAGVLWAGATLLLLEACPQLR